MTHSGTPDVMPVLSRGKHRNPRKGACFMELASYLAGERWSDHPSCTHALLATLARDVNDHVSDAARGSIAHLIPDVIGLDGDDPRVDAWIAREAALTALPNCSMERQGVCAVGLLRCERVLSELEGRPGQHISARTAKALDAVPHARDWARAFASFGWATPSTFARRSGPAIVHSTVSGIAATSVDADEVLVDLLHRVIVLCQGWLGTGAAGAEVTPDRWDDVVVLTRR